MKNCKNCQIRLDLHKNLFGTGFVNNLCKGCQPVADLTLSEIVEAMRFPRFVESENRVPVNFETQIIF